MIIYAHRANAEGPGSGENSRLAVEACLDDGLGVEVDVRCVDGQLWVGHDDPLWVADLALLRRPKVMCHAKDVVAADKLSALGLTGFCIDVDRYALCSDGSVWTNYPCRVVVSSAIACSPELVGGLEGRRAFFERVRGCRGVCTDYPREFRSWFADDLHPGAPVVRTEAS